jgi:hypothetical protein
LKYLEERADHMAYQGYKMNYYGGFSCKRKSVPSEF